MPGNRKFRLQALLLFLVVLVIFYVTTAKRSTYSSPFYTRTMAALSEREVREAKADKVAAEERKNDRVQRIRDEHEIAMGDVKAEPVKQKPVVAELKDKVVEKADQVKDAAAAAITAMVDDDAKPVAGRKTLKDGKVVVDGSGRGTDGVAKVGNVEPKEKETSAATNKETEEERKVDAEINSILKKGPIVIFSKSYCPFSKKAKNILQNLYTIVPPPYVVELDEHAMGAQMQNWLGKSTGRRTVPNVMVNGKSIGGGDDIESLHNEGKLIEKIQALGGKRIVEISKADGVKRKIRRVRRA